MNIEITRAFSRKVNRGNYETQDYFCSAKKEVDESEADQTSKELSQFVQGQVMNDIEEYKQELEDKKEIFTTSEPTKELTFGNIKLV